MLLLKCFEPLEDFITVTFILSQFLKTMPVHWHCVKSKPVSSLNRYAAYN